ARRRARRPPEAPTRDRWSKRESNGRNRSPRRSPRSARTCPPPIPHWDPGLRSPGRGKESTPPAARKRETRSRLQSAAKGGPRLKYPAKSCSTEESEQAREGVLLDVPVFHTGMEERDFGLPCVVSRFSG